MSPFALNLLELHWRAAFALVMENMASDRLRIRWITERR